MERTKSLQSDISKETHDKLWDYFAIRKAEQKAQGKTYYMSELVEELLTRSLDGLNGEGLKI